jgi:hypothetical protein
MMIRFGWLKKAKKSKYQINIVDFWDPKDGKKRWDTPTLTVQLADWLNIVDVVQELKDIIVSGGTDLPELYESLGGISEAVKAGNMPPKKMIAFGTAKGVEYNRDEDTYAMYVKKMEAAGVWDPEEYRGFKVTKNNKESNSTEDVFQGAEKQLAEKKWSDPELVFGDIEKLTKIVATGGANGLIVAGMAGMGKCTTGETRIPVFGL